MPHDEDNHTREPNARPAGALDDRTGAGAGSGKAAFLLELNDAIRARGAADIPQEATRRLGAWLGVDRVLWAERDASTVVLTADRTGGSDGVLEGRNLDDVLPGIAEVVLAGGRVHASDDIDPAGGTSTTPSRPGWARAVLAVPVMEDGSAVAALVAASGSRREWEEPEAALTAEVAVRTWRELDRARAAEDLREREERYRFLVESAQEYAIFMMDPGGWITSWNTGAERIFGYSTEEALGRSGSMIFTLEQRDEGIPEAEMATAADSGRAADERWHVRKDGTTFWASGVMESLRTSDGALRGFAKVLRDNTRRRNAEQALARERTRLDTVLEVLPVGVVIADADGRIERANAASRKLWGVPLETRAAPLLDYQNFVAWWPETGNRIEAHEWAMARAVRDGQETRDELVLNQKFGSDERRYYLDNVVPIRDPDGAIVGGAAAMVDVTDRLAAERALREYRERLEDLVEERTREVRELAAHLSRVEQQERARIAQVLHDSVQQHLHAVQAKQGNVARILRGASDVTEDVVAELREAQEWTSDAIRVTRSLAVDLNPPVLRQHGLARALSWLASQTEQMHGLQVELTANYEGDRLPWEVRLVAYQLVRELLFNVVKHADTDRAWVRVSDEAEHVAVEVDDAGAGFAVSEIGAGVGGGGLGLASVRERIHYLGGDLELESHPGRGTSVRMRIPVHRADAGPVHADGDDPRTSSRHGDASGEERSSDRGPGGG